MSRRPRVRTPSRSTSKRIRRLGLLSSWASSAPEISSRRMSSTESNSSFGRGGVPLLSAAKTPADIATRMALRHSPRTARNCASVRPSTRPWCRMRSTRSVATSSGPPNWCSRSSSAAAWLREVTCNVARVSCNRWRACRRCRYSPSWSPTISQTCSALAGTVGHLPKASSTPYGWPLTGVQALAGDVGGVGGHPPPAGPQDRQRERPGLRRRA